MCSLIDERSQPSLRERIGSLFTTAVSVDIAVGSIRIAAIDLDDSETRSVAHVRILLRRLVGEELASLRAHGSAHLDSLLAFLESGRVEIRSAGIAAWTPDFSIYRGGPDGDVCLVGPHWFREPPVAAGPTFTAVLTGPADIALAGERFDRLWQQSHDVMLPVTNAVRRRHSFDGA